MTYTYALDLVLQSMCVHISQVEQKIVNLKTGVEIDHCIKK